MDTPRLFFEMIIHKAGEEKKPGSQGGPNNSNS